MTRPQDIIDAILVALKTESAIDDDVKTFVGYEPDIDRESLKLPVLEVSPGPQLMVDETNSDFVGFKTDSNGNHIGKIFQLLYSLEINIEIWTAQGSRYSPRQIGNRIRQRMYEYDTSGPSRELVDESGEPLSDVWRVRLEQGQQTDEFGRSPTLRRWQQTLTVWASEEYVEEDVNATIQQVSLDIDLDGEDVYNDVIN